MSEVNPQSRKPTKMCVPLQTLKHSLLQSCYLLRGDIPLVAMNRRIVSRCVNCTRLVESPIDILTGSINQAGAGSHYPVLMICNDCLELAVDLFDANNVKMEMVEVAPETPESIIAQKMTSHSTN